MKQKTKVIRHSINCSNENKSFASLRQIYSNKDVNCLCDLFVKSGGDIDWAVDILLKKSKLSYNNESSCLGIIPEKIPFACDCDSVDIENNISTTFCHLVFLCHLILFCFYLVTPIKKHTIKNLKSS